MASFDNTTVTNKAIALDAKLLMGDELHFTRASVGGGYVNPIMLREQTDLTGYIMDISITNINKTETGCEFYCNISNILSDTEVLDKDVEIKQIGIFASDPDEGEILYLIAQVNSGEAVTIPAYSQHTQGSGVEFVFRIDYSTTDNFTANVNVAGFLTRNSADNRYATRDYVDEQVHLATAVGVQKFLAYDIRKVAEEEGQTVFEITEDDLLTFDARTDKVYVHSGRQHLSPIDDYVLEDRTITLTEGVPLGRTIDITVQKFTLAGDDGAVSGKVIQKGTLPFDRLANGFLAFPLMLKSCENGYGSLMKNHSKDEDYGTVLTDVDKDGNVYVLSLNVANGTFALGINGKYESIYTGHGMPAKFKDRVTIEGVSYPSLYIRNTTSSREGYTEVKDNGMAAYGNRAKGDSNNQVYFGIGRETDALDSLLKIVRAVNGAYESFNVYHEGNKPTPEDIGALKAEDLTVTSDIPLHFSINSSGGLRITYDDGK